MEWAVCRCNGGDQKVYYTTVQHITEGVYRTMFVWAELNGGNYSILPTAVDIRKVEPPNAFLSRILKLIKHCCYNSEQYKPNLTP